MTQTSLHNETPSLSKRQPDVERRQRPRPAPTLAGKLRTSWKQAAPQWMSDFLAIFLGCAVTAPFISHFWTEQIPWACAYLVVAIAIDVAHVRKEASFAEEAVFAAKVGLAAFVFTAVVKFSVSVPLSRAMLGTVTLAMFTVRPVAFTVLRRSLFGNPRRDFIVTVCGDAEVTELEDAISSSRHPRQRIVARLGLASRDGLGWHSDSYFGRVEELIEVCKVLRATKVIFGESQRRDAAFLEALITVNELGVTVRPLAHYFEEQFGRVSLVTLDTSWFLADIGPLHHLGYRAARRVVDLLAGTIGLVLLALIGPFVALAIRLDTKGPVFHKQDRIGQHGRLFAIVKFRTMILDAEQTGAQFAVSSDPRITRVGRLLRRSRLDEIPQSWNLLLGNMSLLGPRPERPQFVPMFRDAIPYYDKRHVIKPGLTGWAQVHEGYGMCVEDTVRKLERDLYYLKHQSIALDARILLATLASVLRLAGR